MGDISIRPTVDRDREWVEALIAERWAAPVVVVHGEEFLPAELPGFVATMGDEPVGLLTYAWSPTGCEIVTLDSLSERHGVGSALIDAVTHRARRVGCDRLWLVTTNDNLDALRFYQRRGFQLVALYRDAVAAARQHKPQIPERGAYGIPIRDELELELRL